MNYTNENETFLLRGTLIIRIKPEKIHSIITFNRGIHFFFKSVLLNTKGFQCFIPVHFLKFKFFYCHSNLEIALF